MYIYKCIRPHHLQPRRGSNGPNAGVSEFILIFARSGIKGKLLLTGYWVLPVSIAPGRPLKEDIREYDLLWKVVTVL